MEADDPHSTQKLKYHIITVPLIIYYVVTCQELGVDQKLALVTKRAAIIIRNYTLVTS